MEGATDRGSAREDREEVGGGGHVRGRTFCSQAPGPERPQRDPEWPTHKGIAFLPQLLRRGSAGWELKAQGRRGPGSKSGGGKEVRAL